MIHDTRAPPTYAPLATQRRRLRDRALAMLYDRHGGRAAASRPDEARPAPQTHAAPSAWERLVGVVRRALTGPDDRSSRPQQPGAARRLITGSAAIEAALAQRLTGPGSGPYSGTPFRPAAGASEDDRAATAETAPGEAARHDHGIIDHSRHVSSLGRR